MASVCNFIASKTLGIYLVHMFILYIMENISSFQLLQINPIISVGVESILVFMISILVIWIVRRIPLIGRIIC